MSNAIESGIRTRLNAEYAKYEGLMKSVGEAEEGFERNQRIAVARTQEGKLQGLELALSIMEERA